MSKRNKKKQSPSYGELNKQKEGFYLECENDEVMHNTATALNMLFNVNETATENHLLLFEFTACLSAMSKHLEKQFDHTDYQRYLDNVDSLVSVFESIDCGADIWLISNESKKYYRLHQPKEGGNE